MRPITLNFASLENIKYWHFGVVWYKNNMYKACHKYLMERPILPNVFECHNTCYDNCIYCKDSTAEFLGEKYLFRVKL